MPFEGNESAVIGAMHTKCRLLASGQPHDHISILGIFCGGTMKGVFGGGAVTAMYEEGFGHAFDFICGLSTGKPAALYLLSGQPRLGTTIYSEECCTRQFFNHRRLSNLCDVGYLVNGVFRDSATKGLNVEQVLKHRTLLRTGVTHYETGEQHFFTPRTRDELFTLTQASVSMPGLCTEPVYFHGERYVDGASVNPLPIRELIALHKPTHVVVIANRARAVHARTSLLETLLNEVVFRRRMSGALRRAMRARRELMSESFRWALTKSPVPTLISWGDTSVSNFTRNPTILRTAAERSRIEWVEALRRGQQ